MNMTDKAKQLRTLLEKQVNDFNVKKEQFQGFDKYSESYEKQKLQEQYETGQENIKEAVKQFQNDLLDQKRLSNQLVDQEQKEITENYARRQYEHQKIVSETENMTGDQLVEYYKNITDKAKLLEAKDVIQNRLEKTEDLVNQKKFDSVKQTKLSDAEKQQQEVRSALEKSVSVLPVIESQLENIYHDQTQGDQFLDTGMIEDILKEGFKS